MSEVEQLRMLLEESLNMHQRNLWQSVSALSTSLGHRCDAYSALQGIAHRSRAALDTIKMPSRSDSAKC